MTAVERVLRKCVRIGTCLVWRGSLSRPGGYGQIKVNGRREKVHRVIYAHVHGPIPDGMTIDHVAKRGCRFKACCEETHLEAVTNRENILRGGGASATNARKTHCKRGHPLSGDNLYASQLARGVRDCKACARARRKGY